MGTSLSDLDHSGYSAIAEKYHCDGLYLFIAIQEDHTQEKLAVNIQDKSGMNYTHHINSGWMNAERFVDAKQYELHAKLLRKL